LSDNHVEDSTIGTIKPNSAGAGNTTGAAAGAASSTSGLPASGPGAIRQERPKWIEPFSLVITAVATVAGVLVGIYLGRQSDETARIIAINALSLRVENVMDSHQGSRACSRYAVKAGLVDALMKSNPVASLPNGRLPDDPTGDKDECVAGLYRTIPYDKDHPVPDVTKWDFAREQIMSFLNIVDAAAALTHVKSPDDFEKERKNYSESEINLVEMLQGIVDDDSRSIMQAWAKVENRDNQARGKPDEKLSDIWKVCRIVDCDHP